MRSKCHIVDEQPRVNGYFASVLCTAFLAAILCKTQRANFQIFRFRARKVLEHVKNGRVMDLREL